MAVLAEGVVFDVEESVLNAPVAATEGQQPVRVGLLGVRLVTRERRRVPTSPVANRSTSVRTSAAWAKPGSRL